MLRIVTRLAHSRAVVQTSEPRPQNSFKASEGRSWILLPVNAREGYRRLIEKQAEVATEFDRIHSVERARDVGSLGDIIEPRTLRPHLIGRLQTALHHGDD